MAQRTGTMNPLLKELIIELKRRGNEQSVNIWKRIAIDLEKPTRQRRVVNLSKINRFAKENEVVVIPGKVLGSGMLEHKLTISAYQISDQAKDKIQKAGAKIVSLLELSKEKPDGKGIRIMG